jgi:hypothetical protein
VLGAAPLLLHLPLLLLLCCSAAPLLRCSAALLLCCSTALQHCCSAALLLCCPGSLVLLILVLVFFGGEQQRHSPKACTMSQTYTEFMHNEFGVGSGRSVHPLKRVRHHAPSSPPPCNRRATGRGQCGLDIAAGTMKSPGPAASTSASASTNTCTSSTTNTNTNLAKFA